MEYKYIKTPVGSIEVKQSSNGTYQISEKARKALLKYGKFTDLDSFRDEEENIWIVLLIDASSKLMMPHYKLKDGRCLYKHKPHSKKCIRVDFRWKK